MEPRLAEQPLQMPLTIVSALLATMEMRQQAGLVQPALQLVTHPTRIAIYVLAAIAHHVRQAIMVQALRIMTIVAVSHVQVVIIQLLP